MASIEAMTKEALRSLAIRVRRQGAAQKELTAAQDMDKRAVDRLAKAEAASTALDTEVSEKAELASRLTGKPVDEILSDIRADLEKADETDSADETTDGAPAGDETVKAAPKKAAKPKPVADAPQA